MTPIRAAAVALLLLVPALAAQPPDRSVVIITLDGLRWQEFFGGADPAYFKRDSKGAIEPAAARYAAPAPETRRAIVMPFVWNVIAKQGQIFNARVTNGLWFSYPGYNEMFAGFADARIDSNRTIPNPNVTVLEWLHAKPAFDGRVAAFGSWDVLPSIVNSDRSGIPVGTGYAISELARDLPAYWEYGPFDAPVVYAALDTIRTKKPRVLYVMLGEGDEWAHEGRYRLYLDATTRADRFIERIWTTLQSMPEYRGRTTLIVTTDHGRGATPEDWSDHGRDVPAAERTWMAIMGPDVPALGVRENVQATTAQVAATIAAAVGEDFRSAVPKAAPPLSFR